MGQSIQDRLQSLPVHTETISATCLQLVKDLGKLNFISQFNLVGGTSLALQIGHRLSIDLDFFSDQEFDSKIIASALRKIGTVSNLRINDSNLVAEVNGVKVEFVYYAYPAFFPTREWNNLQLLNPIDIGLFKLLAILGRHTKKDIVDLYFIDREVIDLVKLFKIFTEKYAKGDTNLFKQVELLFDESRLGTSKMPDMLIPIEFESAYELVSEKILQSIRNYFKL